MEKSEQALHYFTNGYNCSQAVFATFANQFGLDAEQALQIASGFGGGIARLQKTCGAVTGAVMALGLLQSKGEMDQDQKKEQVYDRVRFFIDRFTDMHGTMKCSELLGHSLATPEERKEAKELNLFEKVCNVCVKDAVLVIEQMLKEEKESRS